MPKHAQAGPSAGPVTKPGPSQLSLLLFWLALCIPLLFLGYGSDYDAWRVAQTGETLWRTGIYSPSRSLGFPLYELTIAPLVAMGGWIATNALSLIAGIAIFFSLCRLAGRGHFRHPLLVMLSILFLPIFCKNATVTMDYLPALALLLWAYVFLQETRWDLAALLIGLSVGFRPTGILFIIPAALLIVQTCHSKAILFRALAISGLTAAIAYSPLLFAHNFLAPVPAPRSSAIQHLAFVAFHSLRFLGLAQTLLLAALVGSSWRKRERKRVAAPTADFHLLNMAVWIGLFFLLPDEPEYLLPALPSLIFMMDRILKKPAFIAAVFILLSYHFVQLEVRTDTPDSLRLYPHLAAGYTIEDIQDRIFKLSLREAASGFKPERPTLLMYGLPWITAVNERWTFDSQLEAYKLKDGQFYLAGRITDRKRILDLKQHGFRLVAWRSAVWDYLRTGSTAWQEEVEIVNDVRTLFSQPIRGKALNER
jgi:hypothetical protein